MKKGTPLWKALLTEHRLPWRYTYQGGFLNTLISRRLRRSYLPFLFSLKKEDITVVIAVKNRCDYRLVNALQSIRNQEYDQRLIKIILVDYDSDKELIPRYEEICRKYRSRYIRVDDKEIWNKPHALNIGIREVKTKYLLSSDVDIIFEKNYIKEAIRELKRNPFQVILARCLDLPKDSIKEREFNKLKESARKRFDFDYLSPGINLTYTYFYHKIRGYDEWYQLWRGLDDDLIKRFELLGLSAKEISSKTCYLHQWHPKFDGRRKESKKHIEQQIKKNRDYFESNNSIVRNKKGWGIK